MKSKHIDRNHLTGFIHKTLSDATREEIDLHLKDCPHCRGQLAGQERLQRLVSSEMKAALRKIRPPSGMTFGAIAQRAQPKKKLPLFFQRFSLYAAALTALAGFLMAIFGVFDFIQSRPVEIVDPQAGPYPTLAGFLFVLASVQEFDKSLYIRPRFILSLVVTVLLWMGSAFIGLLNIIAIRDMTILAVISAGGDAASAQPITIAAIMVAAMLYIGVVIGGAEYHYKNFGQPGSWKLFIIVLLVQLFLMVLPYLLI